MEQRLIDANALREKWLCLQGHDFSPSSFVYSIDNEPTVDAVQVVHGHWEIVPNDENRDDYYKMRCSVCGETIWSIQSEELYCCKCGAKMDEDADGERRTDE